MQVGIDIGGTRIKGGLVNDLGSIIYSLEIDTEAEKVYAEVLENIFSLIDRIFSFALKNNIALNSIGIGIPGLADPNSDWAIYCTNLNWNNVPLGIDIKNMYHLPVKISNDATVACLGESICGITKDSSNSLFITLGTGVGGGIIINDKLYFGSNGVGSELGHMVVGENFYNCSCGKNGCWETFVSATALVKYGKYLLEQGLDSRLSSVKMSTRDIFDWAQKGDPLALEITKRFVKYLSIGIVNTINVIDPSIIAIGGGMAHGMKFLLSDIQDEVSKNILYKTLPYGEIKISQLINDAGIIGAAMLHKLI